MKIILSILLFLFSTIISAESVNLQWDRSTSEGVKWYRVGVGQNGLPTDYYVDVGDVDRYTITNLTPGITYSFGVKAGNDETISEFSNIVNSTIPKPGFSLYGSTCIKVTFKPLWETGTTKIHYDFPNGSPIKSDRTTNGNSSTLYCKSGEYLITLIRTVNSVDIKETRSISVNIPTLTLN